MPPRGRPEDKEAETSNTRDAVLENETTWIKKAMKESQEEGKEYYPPLTQRSFDKLKKNRDSLRPEFWSDADEAQVLAQWDVDRAAKSFKQPHPKKQSLWKTSARFLRCLPTELVGMRYGLDYDTRQTVSYNWTQGFCTSLIKIIAHPVFANNPAKIALAIKFSIFSWQRLKWVIPDLNDLFLQTLQKVAGKKSQMVGAELVRDSIEEWRDTWPEEGELPPWAQLLKAIVANSKRPVSAAESPHRVATQHLSTITTSLDEITHTKLVLYHSTSLYERRIKDIRANIDKPTADQDTIEELQAEGIVHNRRLRMLSERYPDIADIYNHVSQPEAHRPVPKEDHADIYIESSEAEQSSEAKQPVQPAQANPQAKRKRGRPRLARDTQELQVEDGLTRKGEAEAWAAKKPRGRPPKNAALVDPAPEETNTNLRPNTADADVPDTANSDDSNSPIVQVARRHDEQKRLRNLSVSDSIANASEQQVAYPSRGLPYGNDDAEDDGFYHSHDDLHGEHDIFHGVFRSQQQMPESSPSGARPGRSHSEELGHDTPAGEDGVDHSLTDENVIDEDANTEHEANEIMSIGRDVAGAIRHPRRSVNEAPPPSAGIDSSVSGGAAYHGASEVQPAQEETEWPLDESMSRKPGEGSTKLSGSTSARGKKRKKNPMPTYSPDLSE